MKKLAAIVIVLLMLAVTLFGCGQKAANKRRFSMPDPLPQVAADALENKSGFVVHEPEGYDEGIPVYKEEELLYFDNSSILPGLDPAYFIGSSYGDIYSILGHFHTDRIRMRDDGALILVYSTDSGFRVFCICDPKQDNAVKLGLAMVVKEQHSYEEFSQLKIGDDISEVEKIDSAAELFVRQAEWLKNDAPDYHLLFNSPAQQCNAPLSTVHYLTDGILMISYKMLDDDETIVISNIIYNEDRILPDPEGNPIDYTVCEDDLPY